MKYIKIILSSKPSKVVVFVLVIILIGNIVDRGNTSNPAPSPIATYKLSPDYATRLNKLSKPTLSLPKTPSSKVAVQAKSYIVIDSDTKYPLIAKNADVSVPIASTTKIMTAIVAMETLPTDQIVTITKEAATISGSEIQLLTNEKISVANLLYALLISSANDSAWALASANGSIEDFVARMNQKAKLLGLTNTHYDDPAGLETGSSSTPRDLALLTNYALNFSLFKTIIATPKYTITSADGKYKHELQNSNRLVDPEHPLYYPQSIGGKTGFTFEAGHCLVAIAAYDNNKYHIAVVLHTLEDSKEASAKEARKLLVWSTQK